MEEVRLEAVRRKKEELGKKFTNKLRKEGFVPAVVYKGGNKTIPIVLKEKDFTKVLHTSAGENVIIELKITDNGEKPQSKTVIIKEMQQHPYKDNILHADFNQIDLDKEIKVKIPIAVKGEAIGVTRDGGILEHIAWEIEVECLPAKIPEKIEVDVADLEVGHSKMVKDLNIPGQVKVLVDPEQMVVCVAAKKTVEEVVAAPEAEAAEPEVITEKKPEEGEEAVSEAPPEEEKK